MNDDSPEPKVFRVLSLDGGGAKGFYTLGALMEIEALVGRRLCEKFDLIYGTSTGAIIAALLGLGKSVDEIAVLSLGFARKHVRVVSIGVGEYPPPKLPAWSLRKWLSKLPTMVFLQKTMEISTQSMDQLRKVLFREVETVRIHNRYTQPDLATDMLEVDMEKLGLPK